MPKHKSHLRTYAVYNRRFLWVPGRPLAGRSEARFESIERPTPQKGPKHLWSCIYIFSGWLFMTSTGRRYCRLLYTQSPNQSPLSVRQSMFNLPQCADTFEKNNHCLPPDCYIHSLSFNTLRLVIQPYINITKYYFIAFAMQTLPVCHHPIPLLFCLVLLLHYYY